jgi:hypothetical protein
MKTRKEYMNNEISHHEYYSQFVTESTKSYVLSELTVEQIKNALDSGDEHFNEIKIPFNNMGSGGNWWWDYSPCNHRLMKELGECNSYSTHTCVGKAAARILIEENK